MLDQSRERPSRLARRVVWELGLNFSKDQRQRSHNRKLENVSNSVRLDWNLWTYGAVGEHLRDTDEDPADGE